MKPIKLLLLVLTVLFSASSFAEHPDFEDFRYKLKEAGYSEKAVSMAVNFASLALVCPAVGVEVVGHGVARLVPGAASLSLLWVIAAADSDQDFNNKTTGVSDFFGGIVGGVVDVISGAADYHDLRQDEVFWEHLAASFYPVKILAKKRYAENSVCMSSIKKLDIMIFENNSPKVAQNDHARASHKETKQHRSRSRKNSATQQ